VQRREVEQRYASVRDSPHTRRHLILGGNVKRITKSVLGGLAGGALILAGTQVASGALTGIYKFVPDDLKPLAAAGGTLASAKANITITEGTNSDGTPATTFDIKVTGIDHDAVGTLYGSHLHTGPCVKSNPGAAGPHYNHDVAANGKTLPTMTVPYPDNAAEISTDTEVWFDIVPNENGVAQDQTRVEFVPIDSDEARDRGVMSIVIHELPTSPTSVPVGFAGARWACFPLQVPQWAEPPATE
jgi:Cu/Zn superoxide dismutase